MSLGGDSSQDEAEDEAKAITVKFCPRLHEIVQTPECTGFSFKCHRLAAGEVRSSWVRAGAAEANPVVRVPPEEAGRRALDSPALQQRQGRGSSHLFLLNERRI